MWLHLNTLPWICDHLGGPLSFRGGGRGAFPKRRLVVRLQCLLQSWTSQRPPILLLSYWALLSLVDKHQAKRGIGVINENEEKHFLILAFQTQLPLFYWSRTLGMTLRTRSPGLFYSWEKCRQGTFQVVFCWLAIWAGHLMGGRI